MKRWIPVLLVALATPLTASAQSLADYDYENLQFRGLGVDFGWVWPTKIEPTISVGVRADMGYVGPHIRITPAVRFWSSTLRESEVNRLADQIVRICERQGSASCPGSLDLGEVRRSDLVLSTDAEYVFAAGQPISPYAGGGLSLHLLNGRGELIDGTFVEDLLDTVAPGFNLLGGIDVPIGSSLTARTEARLILTSDVQYATVMIGGSWTLPSAPDDAGTALR